MSRCFPFPPPGYEKKFRVEDATLLAKEKDKVKKEKKEKKHKKDTDKEKKEGREKDKERSKEKNKEKHKHKDRDEKNGKKRSQYEKSIEGDRFSVEKVGSNSPQSSRVQELDQRIGFVGGATGSQIVHKVSDRANGQSNIPKIAFVFNNGAEQRTVQKGTPMENNINKPTEGKETQKHHNSSKKGEKSKDKNAKRHKGQAEVCTQQTFVYDGPQNDPPKEAAVVQEFERRIRDENGASGSQVGAKDNVIIQKRSQNYGKVGNGYAISFSHTKEKSKFGNGSYSTENGQNNDSQSKVPVVGIVHNFKVEERGCDVAGGVDMSKKAPVEGIERNGFSGKGALDNRKKIQSKDEVRNKPRKEVKVNEEAGNIVGLSRFGQNGSDSTDSSKQFTFKMGNKTPEAIIGKRKEPEANGILYDNKPQPNKLQKTVFSSQPAVENGRHLKSGTTITLSASKQGPANCFNKLNGEEHKSSWTVGAQSPSVTTKSPPASLKPMGPSPLGTTQPPISAKLNGSPFRPTKSLSFVGKVPGVTGCQESSLVTPKLQLTAEKFSGAHETVGCQESAKPPLTAVKVNGTHATVGCQDSAKLPLTAGKVNAVGYQDSTAPPLIAGKVNGTIKAHGSPAVTLKHPSSFGKETVGFQGSAKPPLTAGKVNGTIEAHGAPAVTMKHPSSSGKETVGFQGSAKPPLTAGKVNGTIEAHGSPAVTLKRPSSSGKETVGFQGSAKPPLTAGNVNGTIEAHGSPAVTLTRPSSSGKEKKRKDKSSKLKTLSPHPDTKYLSEILAVPKLEELCEFDDPEWLFESKNISSKEGDDHSDRGNREQVWAKAIHIEPADVYALPYVIPY